jgi:transposase
MYQVDMYYTIKTLLKQGKSLRAISKELGINRVTITKIRDQLAAGHTAPPVQVRQKLLDEHEAIIKKLYEDGYTARLIYQKLTERYQATISYPTVARFVKALGKPEVYIPLITDVAQEGQIDFGYLGRFIKADKSVKVWVFSMVLSYSRYSYYCLALDQKVGTFIACHIKAFEYFTGVPCTVKLDNLKAGVITPSFYEPLMQRQYAEFLAYYGCASITARIRRGQDKGKVESAIKYVKNNFLKATTATTFEELSKQLAVWNEQVANKRVHGTTRKVPIDVFMGQEQSQLLRLPALRYQSYSLEKRKVNAFSHISYRQNFYSVPCVYVGQTLLVKATDTLLRIYHQEQQVALHAIAFTKGNYITQEAHQPVYKQKKSESYYRQQVATIGSNALDFMQALQQHRPYHWHAMIRGILHLSKHYDAGYIR